MGRKVALFYPDWCGALIAIVGIRKLQEIKVTAELPGMDENDIDVTLFGHSLNIKGQKQEETEDKGKDYYRTEYR